MVEHCVLEHDEATGYALVKLTDASHAPYVVCHKYDTARFEWSQGNYFEKLEDALRVYRGSVREASGEMVACRIVRGKFRMTVDFEIAVQGESIEEVCKNVALSQQQTCLNDWVDSLDITTSDYDFDYLNSRAITLPLDDFDGEPWAPCYG